MIIYLITRRRRDGSVINHRVRKANHLSLSPKLFKNGCTVEVHRLWGTR